MPRRKSAPSSARSKKLPNYEYVTIDTALLLNVMENRGFFKSSVGWNETGNWKRLEDLDDILGFTTQHIRQCVGRNRMSYYNLDKLACYLGHHPTLFIRSEYLLPDDARIAEELVS